eukprot:Em0005g832a
MGDSTDDQFSSEHDNTMLIDDEARDEEDGESAGLQAPPRHYCGIGRFRPKCLQVFATKKFFTFILCVYCLIEGAVTTGFIAVVITSLEKRYQLSSTASSVFFSIFEVAVIVSVVFVTHFGGKGHKPRWLGAGIIVQAAGCLVFALPAFVLGPYKTGQSIDTRSELCGSEHFSKSCTEGNSIAYFMFILGFFLIGVGATPLFTLGTSFVDDIVHPKYVSIHLGFFYTMAIVGPALGYEVGGELLAVYVEPWQRTHLTEEDPTWVGAWWMSFLLAAVLYLVCSVPFFLFPRSLHDSHLIRKEREKGASTATVVAKGAGTGVSSQDESLLQIAKGLPRHLKHLGGNATWVFATGAITTAFLALNGLVLFAPKYLQSQFGLIGSTSSLITGAIGVFTGITGVISGAILIFLLKSVAKRVSAGVWLVTLVAILPTIGFITHCPTVELAGVTVSYSKKSSNFVSNGSLLSFCNSHCACNSTNYEPVCGADDHTYFSPCRAGCMNGSHGELASCSCIAYNLMAAHNSTFEQALQNSTATVGVCDNGCQYLPIYLIVATLFLYFLFVLKVPMVFITMRCVSDDMRPLALGVQSMLFRLFGNIPSPLIYGALFDTSCLHWQEECGSRGNCWVYDNDLLSYRLISFPLVGMILTSICTFFAWRFYPGAKTAPLESARVGKVAITNGERETKFESSEGNAMAVNGGDKQGDM